MSEPTTAIVIVREGVSTAIEVERWVVTADGVISFRLPRVAFQPMVAALGGEARVHEASFSLRSGDVEYPGCWIHSWFRNNSVVIHSIALWPWWHCPACGSEIQCPLEDMNDGKCIDCNEPFLSGRLSAKQAEFFRLAKETGDPLLVDPSHPAVTSGVARYRALVTRWMAARDAAGGTLSQAEEARFAGDCDRVWMTLSDEERDALEPSKGTDDRREDPAKA